MQETHREIEARMEAVVRTVLQDRTSNARGKLKVKHRNPDSVEEGALPDTGNGEGTCRSEANVLIDSKALGDSCRRGERVNMYEAGNDVVKTQPEHQQDQQQQDLRQHQHQNQHRHQHHQLSPAARLPVWPAAAPALAAASEPVEIAGPTQVSSEGGASPIESGQEVGWGWGTITKASQRVMDALSAAGDGGSGPADGSCADGRGQTPFVKPRRDSLEPNGAGDGGVAVGAEIHDGRVHVPPLKLSSRTLGLAGGSGKGGTQRDEERKKGRTEREDDDDQGIKQQRDLLTLKRALLGNRMEGVMPISEAPAAAWMTPSFLQPGSRRANGNEPKINQASGVFEVEPGGAGDESDDESEESILHPGFTNMFGLQELARTLTPRNSRECP